MLGAERQTDKQPGRARVIAIGSGKGGVGKSSIAVNVGLSLVKAGARVCILDADTGLANVNILLGINPEFRLDHVLFGARAIEEVVVDGPLGMKVIPGANGISECVSLHPRQQLRLTRELARIESQFDYLLVDTAAGIAETTLDFISAAEQTLLVITPEPTSLTDAFSLVKLMARRGRELNFLVVVNMCASPAEARQVFTRFSTAVTKYIGLRVQMLGSIQRDESLRSAVTLQNPVALYPDTDPSSRSFLRLAEALHDRLAGQAQPGSFAEYWQRQYRQAAAVADAAAEGAPAVEAHRQRGELDGGDAEAGEPRPPPTAPRSVEGAEAGEPGEAVPERELAAWEQDWRALLAGDRLPREQLAGTLVACHEVFWQRFGQPALAVPALIARLADEPERHAALLQAVRSALPADGAAVLEPPVIAPSELAPSVLAPSVLDRDNADVDPAVSAIPQHTAPRSESVPSVASSSIAGQRTLRQPAELQPTAPQPALHQAVSQPGYRTTSEVQPEPPLGSLFSHGASAEASVAPVPPIHRYDESRFGSQARLADLLQRQGASGKTVLELIHALA